MYLLDDGVQQQLHARLQARALEHDLHAFGVEIAAVFRQTAHLFQLVQDFFKNAEDELAALFRRNALLPVGHKGIDQAVGGQSPQKSVSFDQQHAARAGALGLNGCRHAGQPAAADHDVIFSHVLFLPQIDLYRNRMNALF